MSENNNEINKENNTEVKKVNNVNKPLNNKSVEIAKPNTTDLTRIDVLNPLELEAAKAVLENLSKTDKGGIKTVNEGIALLVRAKSLNIPFGAALEHIHVINGKTGVDIHIVKALLLRAGCTWKCTKDYQPLYEYTDGFNVFSDGSLPDYVVRCNNPSQAKELREANKDDYKIYAYPVRWYKDFNGNVYKDYQLNENKFGKVGSKQEAIEVQKSGKIPVYMIPAMPIDYVTEYEITRTIDGKEMVNKGKFSYNDAFAAGLFEKDNYKKYPKIMISHRAFMIAGRDIASDAIMGCYETKELKIINDKPINEVEFVDAEVL